MEHLKTKLVSSLEKVFPTKKPCAEGWSGSLYALRGETVSFQLAYHWDGERKERADISIETPSGVTSRIRTASLVPCAYPCHAKRDEDYLAVEPGLYPDLLEDLDELGMPLVSGQWRTLWIDLEVSKDAPAGAGNAVLTIRRGEETLSETVSVTVCAAQLPEVPIPHTEWFHCDCLADYYQVEVFSERHWEIIENFIRTAVRRGCNMILTPIFTPPLDTAVGGERTTMQLIDIETDGTTYTFGYEKFERWVEMARRCGIRYFEISHLFSQWGAVSCPKIVGIRNGKEEKLFGWHTKADSPEYADFLGQFLTSFTAKIDEMGIGEVCYFHISDEPHLDHLESYGAAKRIVSRYLQGRHMMDALSNYDFYEKGLVDEPVCANDHIQKFLENKPAKLWTYYCTSQCVDVSNRFIVQPGYRTRILGTQLYKYEIAGFLHWGYNFYNSEFSLRHLNPYRCTDADGAFPSGDPFLVYPGADGKPEESIRLMHMQQAMNDLCLMTCLEQLTDRETVMNLVERDQNTVTFDSYPRNIEYLEAQHTLLIQEIEKHL